MPDNPPEVPSDFLRRLEALKMGVGSEARKRPPSEADPATNAAHLNTLVALFAELVESLGRQKDS